MWLFTRYGFFSAVCARQGEGRYGAPVDVDRIMVRARVRAHLDALLTRFPSALAGCEIRQSSATDYAFRIFVAKPAWTEVLSELARDIDYGNFKSEVARHESMVGADYERALHEVWETMYRLQPPHHA